MLRVQRNSFAVTKSAVSTMDPPSGGRVVWTSSVDGSSTHVKETALAQFLSSVVFPPNREGVQLP